MLRCSITCCLPCALCRLRNIFNMRSVMPKPPTTLIVAVKTAMKPSSVAMDGLALGAAGQQLVEVELICAGDDQRADQRDAGDGVGGRHQRRVQQRRNARDHLVAEKRGQHEDVERRSEPWIHGFRRRLTDGNALHGILLHALASAACRQRPRVR